MPLSNSINGSKEARSMRMIRPANNIYYSLVMLSSDWTIFSGLNPTSIRYLPTRESSLVLVFAIAIIDHSIHHALNAQTFSCTTDVPLRGHATIRMRNFGIAQPCTGPLELHGYMPRATSKQLKSASSNSTMMRNRAKQQRVVGL